MDFRVEIADPAIDDLAEIVSYLSSSQPGGSIHAWQSFARRSAEARANTDKGGPYRYIGNVRKLTVRPFKIFYRVNEAKQSVEVLRSGIPRDASQNSELNSGLGCSTPAREYFRSWAPARDLSEWDV